MQRYALIFLTVATALSSAALLSSMDLKAAYPARFTRQYLLNILAIGCAFVFLVLDLIGAVFLFNTHRYLSLLPLLLMLGSCPLRGPTFRKGFQIQMDQFRLNQPSFNEIAVYKEIVPSRIAADWEDDGTLTGRCGIAFFPIAHHKTYIYRPDGRLRHIFAFWKEGFWSSQQTGLQLMCRIHRTRPGWRSVPKCAFSRDADTAQKEQA